MQRLAWISCFVLVACGDDDSSTDSFGESVSAEGSASADDSTGGGPTSGGSATVEGSDGASADASVSSSEEAGSSDGDTSVGTSIDSGESGTGGTFPCGDELECLIDSQYCEAHFGPVMPDSYSCMELPDDCGAVATCECLVGVSACGECEMLPGGGLMTSCLKP